MWIPILSFLVGTMLSVVIYRNLQQREQETLRNESSQRFQEMVNQLDLLFSNSILRIQSYEDYLGPRARAYERDARFVSQSLGYTLFQRLTIARYQHSEKPGTSYPLIQIVLRIDSPQSTLNPVNTKYMETPELLEACKRLIRNNGQQQAVVHTYHDMPRISFILRSKNDRDTFFVFTTPLTGVFAKSDLRPQESLVLTDSQTGLSWTILPDGQNNKKVTLNSTTPANEVDDEGYLYASGLPQSGLKLNLRFNFEPHAESLSLSVIAGLLTWVISLVISYLFYVLVRQNTLVTRLVIEKTHDLEKAHHELQETLLGKSRFLGNISHEIRTPLNLILGMIDLCEEEDVDHKISHYLSSMRSSGNHLLSMIEDLLELAKSESNDLQIQPKKVNLIQFLEELARIGGQDCLKKGLRFYTQWSADLPSGIICDPSRLRQILMNLLRNASKYTSEGHVILRVLVASRDGHRAHLRFEVEDTGVGISEDKLGKIFDAFFQVEGSFALSEGGVGLGLAIVKELVRKLGGTLNVHSRPRMGSTFLVDLDFEVSDETPWLQIFKTVDSEPRHLTLVSDNPYWLNSLSVLAQHPLVSVNVVSPWDFAKGRRGETQEGSCVVVDTASEGFNSELVNSLAGDEEVILVGSKKDGFENKITGNFPVLNNSPVLVTEILNLLGLSARVRKKKESLAPPPAKADVPVLANEYSFIVADDDIGNQELYQAYFDKTPWKVTYTMNGQEALEAHLKAPADLLILDVRMPVMSGFEVVEKVRDLEHKKNLSEKPILLVTADALGGTGEKALTYKKVSFLTKPIKKTVLFEEIQRVLDKDSKNL